MLVSEVDKSKLAILKRNAPKSAGCLRQNAENVLLRPEIVATEQDVQSNELADPSIVVRESAWERPAVDSSTGVKGNSSRRAFGARGTRQRRLSATMQTEERSTAAASASRSATETEYLENSEIR
jgi:hypothetical protein